MTGRMFGGERGAGGAGGRGRAGRKGGDADERGSKVTPPPEEKKKPVSAEVRSQRRGGSGLVVPGETPRQRKRSRREIEVKEEESRVEREKREDGKRGKQTGGIN